ncbi:MAG TPA: ABC transporter ATP-binding protein [Polyangiaceae bacterium]|nr:ABC transporter ATP-binding protein [Polyangiaceae bacterium]
MSQPAESLPIGDRLISGMRLRAPGKAPEPPPLLIAENVTKRFGSQTVLDSVSLRLEPGTVHALLGENGAGKSTLVKCIMGFYHADGGRVVVGNSAVHIKNPKDAQHHGIGMVYQHFTLVENMTVAENLVLSRADVPALIDWKKEHAALDAFMAKMPFSISPNRLVRQLAAGEKQKLEILKQLYLGSRIVILDEPTSVLTPDEADNVLGMLRDMTRRGELSVLMITHKFREVTRFCDEVTVLRKGRFAGAGQVSELSTAQMAEMMVGAEPPSASYAREATEAGEVVLAIQRLEADDDLGLPILNSIDLQVRAGEIVGIAGVSGNGQDQLVEVLGGQRTHRSGSISVDGAAYRATRAEIRRLGVRLLPEAPLRNACVSNMSVAENIGFRSFDVSPFTLARWLVRRSKLRHQANTAIGDYRIKTPSADERIGNLSGGNVQRAVLARELHGQVRLLIVANPCFGLDFAAVAEIRTRIMNARNAGAAVLLVSADLDEIFALSDRILVMSEGAIVHEAPASTADLQEIGRHMAGHG